MGMFSEASRTDLFLARQARRLTHACMRSIYDNVEINFDHLFSYALRAHEGDAIPVDDLRAALYLAATELAEAGGVRLHPSMENGITTLVTGEPYPPWDDAVALATAEGVVSRENAHFTVDRDALHADHDWHTIRLRNMTQVIANELEPVQPAVEAVRRNVNLSSDEIRTRTAEVLHEREKLVYERDYATAYDPRESNAKEVGEPFFFEAEGATTGVVLAHGYLASPRQVRGLAERLHAAGLTVCGVRLAGHGTAPEQLARVRWEDWMDCMVRGYGLVRQRCARVVAGGFSLGGVLALLLAARLGERVHGVFGISPPFKLRDRRLPLVGPLLGLNGAMRLMGLADGEYRFANEGTEAGITNYGTDYLKGVRELRRATRACRRALGSITAPALIVQGDADPLVDPASGRLALAELGSADKVLTTLAFDRHVIVRYAGSEAVFSLVARFARRLDDAYRRDTVRPPR
jgi:esterase/lipase